MITNPFDLQKIPPPFGANGRHGGGGGDGGGGTGGGTGGGGGACCVRGILRKEQPVSPNFASGNVYRQEAIIAYTEEAPDGDGHQTTWFRSFYQGLHSGYKWLLPSSRANRYHSVSSDLYQRLERKLNLSSHFAREERLDNLMWLDDKPAVLKWISGFDFDVPEPAIDHYFNNKWGFIGGQVYSTFRNSDPFYRIVSEPLQVVTRTKSRQIQYPLQLTGASKSAEVKSTEIRLYLITRYRLKDIPDGFSVEFDGIVEFDLGDWFVTVLEGELDTKAMTNDLTIDLDRKKLAWE